MNKPVVFISSTCEDLKRTGHREAARDAALGAGFYLEMQEYWAANDIIAHFLKHKELADIEKRITAIENHFRES